MLLVVGTNTWVSLEDANIYMSTRLGASTFWNTAAEKEAALVTAYNFLMASDYDFPTDISNNMIMAQCETALFLLQHQEDMDARMGLQAQGVTEAGVVQEKYSESLTIPLPAVVRKLIAVYETITGFETVNVSRDDNEDAI